MPSSLTITEGVVPVSLKKEQDSVFLPWEFAGYAAEAEALSKTGGVFDLSHWAVIEIKGPDTADYLQRMSTVNLKNLPVGAVAHGAFLTGRGNAVTMGWFERVSEDQVLNCVPSGLAAVTLEHIEKFHFAENFQVTDQSESWTLLGLVGKIAEAKFPSLTAPLHATAASLENIPVTAWRDDTHESFYWVRVERSAAVPLLQKLHLEKTPFLGQRLFEFLRIKDAVPQVGVELGDKNIILEGNFDRVIHRNKGCYPGQEVVERITSYGQVTRKLMPVVISAKKDLPAVPFSLKVADKTVGTVVSQAEVPGRLGQSVGLAYIHKAFLTYAESFGVESSSAGDVVVKLRKPAFLS